MNIPRISDNLSDKDSLKNEVALNGNSVRIETANWHEFPYKPYVSVSVAHDGEYLYFLFDVKENHLLVKTLEDNGPVWEDSCVEIFIGDPDGEHYYNFETNAAGVILASKRKNRNDFERFNADMLSEIIRMSSLERKKYDIKNPEGIQWNMLVGIPFSLIGHDQSPSDIRLNLYKCGDATDRPHFLSLFPISTPTPDFHRPESFRSLRLA